MKLEVARSKVALEAEVKQKEDALRLLRESRNANLHMQADYQPRCQAKGKVVDWRHEGHAKEIQ